MRSNGIRICIRRPIVQHEKVPHGFDSMDYGLWKESPATVIPLGQTQGSNLCLLHCRQILNHWATREAHSLALDNGIYWAPFSASTEHTSLPLFTPASPEDRTKFPRKQRPLSFIKPIYRFQFATTVWTVLNWFPPYYKLSFFTA